jgi:hypothetical protein
MNNSQSSTLRDSYVEGKVSLCQQQIVYPFVAFVVD